MNENKPTKKEFRIGDKVWISTFHIKKDIKVPCPVCFGKLKVTLILGNDDHIELPCDYCGKGYEGPTGYDVHYQDAVAETEPITIGAMQVDVTPGGKKIDYYSTVNSCRYIYSDEKVFATQKEALEKAEELKNKWLKDESTRADRIKHNVNKSFSWNAGYHMKEARRIRRQIEYHESKAKLCKDRAR
ncbi:MAG: hypothetical protein ACXAD7_26090 [Candidatus Kariarchaeaceae archaeon]|jgi:hypothetical protein